MSFYPTASLCRLEFQHGFSLPVPQLASVCGGVCAAVCLCSGSTHFYAWEPPLLLGGKRETQCIVMLAAPLLLLMTMIMTLRDIREYQNLCGITFSCQRSSWCGIYFLTEKRELFIYHRLHLCINAEVFKLWGPPPQEGAGETKILRKVKGTGACRRSKNKGKLVIVVWPTDLACLTTRPAVGAAAVAVTNSSWFYWRKFESDLALLPRFIQ